MECQLIERQGKPAFVICDVADEINADVIVMGTRGLSLEADEASTASRVIQLAPCPVLVRALSEATAAEAPPDAEAPLDKASEVNSAGAVGSDSATSHAVATSHAGAASQAAGGSSPGPSMPDAPAPWWRRGPVHTRRPG
jgi:hypothetical protein